jgi:glutaredoxin 3
MTKRRIEVFTAGCPVCEEVVAALREAACPSCQIEVRPMAEPVHAEAAASYGIQRLPTVVVDGRIADCCRSGGVDLGRLEALGLGQPAA